MWDDQSSVVKTTNFWLSVSKSDEFTNIQKLCVAGGEGGEKSECAHAWWGERHWNDSVPGLSMIFMPNSQL